MTSCVTVVARVSPSAVVVNGAGKMGSQVARRLKAEGCRDLTVLNRPQPAVLTESLAHSLRNAEGARISAHLLIPGSTFTEMTRGGKLPSTTIS